MNNPELNSMQNQTSLCSLCGLSVPFDLAVIGSFGNPAHASVIECVKALKAENAKYRVILDWVLMFCQGSNMRELKYIKSNIEQTGYTEAASRKAEGVKGRAWKRLKFQKT